MNNSTTKSVVIVGLLFLAGLVALSFVNFLAFSPATEGILQATAIVATQKYESPIETQEAVNADVKATETTDALVQSLVFISRFYRCGKNLGMTSCATKDAYDEEKAGVSYTIQNDSPVEIYFHAPYITDTNGRQMTYDCDSWGEGNILPHESTNISCNIYFQGAVHYYEAKEKLVAEILRVSTLCISYSVKGVHNPEYAHRVCSEVIG